TWFSSWLWPMEVFKGISNPGNEEINYYYPTSVLVTGQDIIFFWVARMIMAGMEYKNEKPFSDVYFTGMVRDKQGRKMSKSLGNSPDLLELIDRFGADAVRFGIMISSPAGNDLLFDESSCEQGRMFNNKIWNALKLVKMWEGRRSTNNTDSDDFAVKWFEARLNQARAEIEELQADFRLSEALKVIYSLIWDDFCSWYLEWVKPGFELPIDANVYDHTIKFFGELMQLLHPYMPFITEEVHHHLSGDQQDLAIRQFSEIGKADAAILRSGDLLKEAITAIRDARNKNQLKPKDPIDLHIIPENEKAYGSIKNILQKQVNAGEISFVKEAVANTIAVVVNKDQLFIDPKQELDTASQREQLLKDLEYFKGFLAAVEKKLGNEKFVANAKAEVVENERKKKADALGKIEVIENSLRAIGVN